MDYLPEAFRLDGGHVLTHRTAGLFQGWLPIEPPVTLKPEEGNLTWLGAPLPRFWWDRIRAFFAWTQDTYSGESQIRLFYRDDIKLWYVMAFPQEISHGLSTHEIEHDPEKEKYMSAILSAGFSPMGTVHHHCCAPAYQSGTDLNDEQKQFGIHITLGNINSSVWSYHWRVSFRGVMYTQAQPLTALIPDVDLSKPDEGVRKRCPKLWKAQLKEAPPPPVYKGTTYHYGDNLAGWEWSSQQSSDYGGRNLTGPTSPVYTDHQKWQWKPEKKDKKKKRGPSPPNYWTGMATRANALSDIMDAQIATMNHLFPGESKETIRLDLISLL